MPLAGGNASSQVALRCSLQEEKLVLMTDLEPQATSETASTALATPTERAWSNSQSLGELLLRLLLANSLVFLLQRQPIGTDTSKTILFEETFWPRLFPRLGTSKSVTSLLRASAVTRLRPRCFLTRLENI